VSFRSSCWPWTQNQLSFQHCQTPIAFCSFADSLSIVNTYMDNEGTRSSLHNDLSVLNKRWNIEHGKSVLHQSINLSQKWLACTTARLPWLLRYLNQSSLPMLNLLQTLLPWYILFPRPSSRIELDQSVFLFCQLSSITTCISFYHTFCFYYNFS